MRLILSVLVYVLAICEAFRIKAFSRFVNNSMCPEIISRRVWKAYDARKPSVIPSNLYSRVALYYSPMEDCCYFAIQCAYTIKKLQKLDQDRYSHPDTRYNYFLGFDANIYEGSGWGTYSTVINKDGGPTLNICVVGGGSPKNHPTLEMIQTFFLFLDCYRGKHLTENFTISVASKYEISNLYPKRFLFIKSIARLREGKFTLASVPWKRNG